MTNPLEFLIGTWTTEATHPAFPGLVVRGRTTFEWGPAGAFVVQRAENEHPDFPDSVAILGQFDDEPPAMHYFDSRGIRRVYLTSVEGDRWRIWREHPGFSQRLDAEIRDDGATIAGVWQLCTDDATWADDLAMTFRRA